MPHITIELTLKLAYIKSTIQCGNIAAKGQIVTYEGKIGKVKHCSTLTEYFAISKAYPDESQLIFMLIKMGPHLSFSHLLPATL